MASFVAQARLDRVARRSVARLRDVVSAGSFSHFAAVDPQTGDILNAEARSLFTSLPSISPSTSADELVAHGLIRQAPAELARAYARPRYREGREIFVRTTIDKTPATRTGSAGRFLKGGSKGFTHLAELLGQEADAFIVRVQGSPTPMRFPRSDVYSWNEPCGVPPGGGTISGVQVDYNEPRLKAFICAGYLTIGAALAAVDFSADDEDVCTKQKEILYDLASMIDMRYAGRSESYRGNRAGSLIGSGAGVCFVQRAVAGAFLQAFSRILAFEIQIAVGRTQRLGVPHGFVVVTLLPSLRRYVVDPAWAEPMTSLPVAFFGPGWGHDRRLEGFEGQQDLVVRPSDVDLPQISNRQ